MVEAVGETAGNDELTPLVPQLRLRVVVGSRSVEQFVDEYSRFVEDDRIFIATDAIETPGNLVQFRLDLADGTALVHGTGTVLEARPLPRDGLPRGMVLRFVALDEPSARLIDAMTARRARAAAAATQPAAAVRPAAAAATETTVAATRAARAAHDATARLPVHAGARAGVLPANPLSDVPEAALGYFVDWAIERNGGGASGAPVVSFGAVRMRAPRRARRPPSHWAAFAAGLALGGLVILSTTDLWRDVLAAAPPRDAPAAGEVAPQPASRPRPRPKREPAPPAAREIAAATPARESAPAPAAIAAPAPAGRYGKAPLVVSSEPAAEVWLDGARVGHTPLTLHVAPGPHQVDLQRPRYQTAHLPIDAPGGIAARLVRPRATLRITADVPAAAVIVDGEAVGRAPIDVDVAGFERAQVEVRAPGARPFRAHPYVKPPQTELHARLAR